MTTRAMEIALHMGEAAVVLPDTPPAQANSVLTANPPAQPGGAVVTAWSASGGGSASLPVPTGPGQALISDATPAWTAADLDCGRF